MDAGTKTIPELQVEQLAATGNIPGLVPVTAPPTEAAAVAADEESQVKHRSNSRITLIIIALCFALFVSALNTTIVATAIPTICADLHSAAGYSWVGGAFLLGNVASMQIWVKFSDIWGRKPILLATTGSYFFSSMICALAKNISTLIAGRGLQGIAAGGIVQLVNIVISDLFSMRRRALFLGATEIVWAVAAAIGPLLGGVFAELASWRWIFWICLPISGTSFLLVAFFLDVHDPKTKAWDGIKAIDWFGSLSSLALLLMLLLGLDFGGTVFPWNSATVICLIIFGALMSVVFVFSEVKLARYPLVPMYLLKNVGVAASILLVGFQTYGVIAIEYYLPLYFQSALGASPVKSGALLVPFTVVAALFSMASGMIIHRYGKYKELIVVATIIFSVGVGCMITFKGVTSVGHAVGVEVIAGIGGGLLFLPPIIALQAQVKKQDDVATATGMLGLGRNLGDAISVILSGVVFQNGMQHQSARLRDAGVPASIADQFTGKNAGANVNLIKLIKNTAQQNAVKEAFALSLRNIWIISTVLQVLSVAASVFIKNQALSTDHTETRTGLKQDMKEPIEQVELRDQPQG